MGRPATWTVERAGATTPSGAKVFGVEGVHGGEVGHVFEEDGGFDDVGEVEAGGGEDGLEVFEDAGGLGCDAAGDQRAGGGVEGDLAGGVEGVADADGLGVGADGGWSGGSGDGGLGGMVKRHRLDCARWGRCEASGCAVLPLAGGTMPASGGRCPRPAGR